MVKNLTLLIIVTITNFSLWGCGGSKVTSCRSIQETATQLNQTIVTSLNSEDISQIKLVIQNFREATNKLVAQRIKDENLSFLSKKNLADIYEQYAVITENYLIAYEKKDREKIVRYKQQLHELSARQNQIVKKINNYCQS